MSTNKKFIWTEVYRPKRISDCILPAHLQTTFEGIVKQGEFQNLLLCGGPGCGKTTVAKALCNEMGIEYFMINASEEGNIDTLRTTIKSFATSVSMLTDKPKAVILDESDSTTPAFQAALRSFSEQYSSNCRFILTCNFKNKMIEPIQSRCTVIDFKIPPKERAGLAAKMQTRCEYILKENGISWNGKSLSAIIIKYFPDFRRIINELQRYSVVGGVIDEGILTPLTDKKFKELAQILKDKDYTQMRKWVTEHSEGDITLVSRKLFDSAKELVEASSIPKLVLILADYAYKHAFVQDPEINIVAMMCELMVELEWK